MAYRETSNKPDWSDQQLVQHVGALAVLALAGGNTSQFTHLIQAEFTRGETDRAHAALTAEHRPERNRPAMTTTANPAPAPVSDAEARMRVFQIIGSDIPPGTAAFTGDWHQALKTTARQWAPTAGSESPADSARPSTSPLEP